MPKIISKLLLLGLLIAAMFWAPHSFIKVWDEQGVKWLAEHRSSFWNTFFIIITNIGGAGFLIGWIGTCILLFLKRRYSAAIVFFLGLVLLKISSYELKNWIARPRPRWALLEAHGYSMPSGHAFNGFVLYGLFAVLLWKALSPRSYRAPFKYLLALMVVLTAFSRVYLGVHYPSDVILGVFYPVVGVALLKEIKSFS